jgi:alkanesulfonate monooxygenase SsuD/methylene tetrahydromethanopterin reductase-like flavin-dependent oxidoreductase (luciferase family)
VVTIGIDVPGADAATIAAGVVRAERLGIPAAWVTTPPLGPDGLTVLAASAARTERILIGSGVTPIFPRHPIVTAGQALAVASLAPDRFRLGVGPGHPGSLQAFYGIPQRQPLSRLRACIKVLKGVLQEGAVELDEAGIVARVQLPVPPPRVPVMASALRAASFELCGELADGAISWLCPARYLADVALPALRAGAARAGREVPPLIMHVPVCVCDDVATARDVLREQFSHNPRMPFYQAMFDAAGFPEARTSGTWSDAMIEAVAVFGSENSVVERLEALSALGVGELLVSPLGAGRNHGSSLEATLKLLASLSR